MPSNAETSEYNYNSQWQPAPAPLDEAVRLAELMRYEIIDTQPEVAFDRITRMAAEFFDVPIALVSLVDKERQWFKSHHGINTTESPRDLAFCAHVILEEGVMVVPDATLDPRFAQHPSVLHEPNIRFYAGAPLKSKAGHNLGTVCVVDTRPHLEITGYHIRKLADLAAIAIDEMELRLALINANRDLAELRTVKDSLEQTRYQAEVAIQEKAQFIATISHELRTPMNGILGMAYLLQDTKLDIQQKEYVDTINHSASNLLLLINDVLDLSKIEAKELIIEHIPFDIKKGFMENIKLLTPLANKKNIGVFYNIEGSVPDMVTGDACRFSQIMNNLLGNAIKFTDKGSVTASLSYHQEIQTIYCEIQDSGIGIAENNRSAVFEKFIQGDASITRKYGGTGLGLAITKKLVLMLGGDINFSSEIGAGSTFWFTMPIKESKPADIQSSQEERIFTKIRKHTAECEVLIAEDNPVNHFFLEKLLRKFGFKHIVIAENGVIALQVIASHPKPFDVIFMDCLMPEKDGYDTTRAIRAQEKNDPQPTLIIAMTANAMSGDKENCLLAGMDAYITKPLHPNALKDALSEWFIFATQRDSATLNADSIYDAFPPLDTDRLAMVAENEEEKAMIMGLFFRIQKDAMNIMQESRRNAEINHWKNAAHRLKGSAANLGMRKLSYLLEKAETGMADSYDARTELLREIEHEVQRIKGFMNMEDA